MTHAVSFPNDQSFDAKQILAPDSIVFPSQSEYNEDGLASPDV